VSSAVATKAWIIRKGNGQLQVYPSPVVLKIDETFKIRNLTDSDATAVFPDGTVVGPNGEPRVSIRAGKCDPDLKVVAKEPKYFEYDVTLGRGLYAEGGSKPGGIIDP